MNSRRRFLLQASSLAATMLCSPLSLGYERSQAASGNGGGEYFLIGDGERGGETLFGNAAYAARPGRVRIWHEGMERAEEIKLPFLPHSFVAHPQSPQRVVTFEKWGAHVAEFDLQTREVIRITKAVGGRRFFGHGVHDGRYFYATQMDDNRGRGLVSIFDGDDHHLLSEIDTLGAFPHDCLLLPGGTTLLVVNSRQEVASAGGRNASSLSWVDLASGACGRQLTIATEEFGYAHMARASDGSLILAGSYDNPAGRSQPLLAVVNPDSFITKLLHRATSLQGEVLSLFLDEPNSLLVATLPMADLVQVWDYQTGKLVQQLSIEKPRGLVRASSPDSLLVSNAQSKGFTELGIGKTFQKKKLLGAGLGGNGSHILRLML